ncbi:MAG: hypothetical protein AMS15_07515 [Planctomycetes bacterium DG_23]|nr:MAG: hypothetical protein AMS15_07515 [Planctomycetes bacterium DG_23]
MKISALISALCIFLFLTVPSCGKAPGPKRDPDTIYYSLSDNPTVLDPALVKDVAGGELVAKMFNGLVRYSLDGHIEGDLAESWEVSEDGTIYTFRLRSGVRFANGRVLTAEDVQYSFERVLRPQTAAPRTWVLDKILGAKEMLAGEAQTLKGLEVLDEGTVRITLSEPFGPFLGLLIMPAAQIVPKEEVEKYGRAFSQHPLGTGPFRLTQFIHDERLVFEANPFYFEGPPKVKSIVYKIIKEPLSKLTEFKQGLLDITDIPRAYFLKFRQDPEYKDLIASVVGLNTYYLGFNCSEAPFDDVKIRRAFSYAIDRKKIVETVLAGRTTAAKGPIPPGISGYDPELAGYDYDPAKAKRLLEEAGWPWERRVRIIHPSGEDIADIVEILKSYLQAVGIKAETLARERTTYKDMLRRGNFDLYYYSWWADYLDGENFLAPLFLTSEERTGGNATAYSNPEVDALIRKAQREPDAARRVKLYQEIQRLVVADAPRIFLWHRNIFTIHQPWIKDYRLYPIYNGDKSNLLWIDKAVLTGQP